LTSWEFADVDLYAVNDRDRESVVSIDGSCVNDPASKEFPFFSEWRYEEHPRNTVSRGVDDVTGRDEDVFCSIPIEKICEFRKKELWGLVDF